MQQPEGAGAAKPAVRRRGILLVLSSPSGAGKSTISRALLEQEENLTLSISVTTRPKRPAERDGVDYRFVDGAKFDELVENDALLEHATVFGNRYGTPRDAVESALVQGRDVLFDIDWQGTQQVADKLPGDLVRVFILPPSLDELEARLHRRAQDTVEEVRRRMAEDPLLGAHGITTAHGMAEFEDVMKHGEDLIKAADADLYSRKGQETHG